MLRPCVPRSSMREATMAVRCKGAPVPTEVLLLGGRGSLASPLRPRPVEARRAERGGAGEHAARDRGGIPYSPQRAEAVHRRQRPVWIRGRMDETAITGQGRARAGATTGPTLALLRPAA